jgi:hypothetical protein
MLEEADEPGECTDAAIRELLLKYGYRELAATMEIPEDKPAKRKYARRAKPEAVGAAVEESAEEVVSAEEAPAAPEVQLPTGSDTLKAEPATQLASSL